MDAQELLQSLKTYATRSRSEILDLKQFVAFSRLGISDSELWDLLDKLVETGKCALIPPEGTPQSVKLTGFTLALLEEEYRSLGVDPLKPFPQESTLHATIPDSQIISVDMKTNFALLFAEPPDDAPQVARLVFPEDVDTVLVPRSLAASALVEASVAKLSVYLSDPKNAGYAESKLMSIFKGNDVLVRQMVEDAAQRPKKATETVFSPTDFSFRFWTYLVNLVLQDLRKKKDKTVQDHGICQSAYIVGYYAFYRKGQTQKEQELAADRKSLEQMVRKPPYVFTFENLYALRDEKGVPFVTKHTHQFVHSFLKEKTQRTGNEGLPPMVRVHDAARKKDYFIHKDLVIPVFLKGISETGEELREAYIESWITLLKQHQRLPFMKDDQLFRQDVEAKVKEGYPLLACLTNPALLYLAKTEANLDPESAKEIHRCFATDNTLRSLEELLALDRAAIFSEAWSYLPVWETMPIVRHLVALFRSFFRRDGKLRQEKAPRLSAATRSPAAASRPASDGNGFARVSSVAATPRARREQKKAAAAEKENVERYRKALELLREHYAPPGKSLEDSLDDLAEKWNPLFAERPKQELVEDVNALVRDFLRPVRRTLLAVPPTSARIQALAEQLSGSQTLAKIKKKEPLVRYIELYMIKCLEPKKKQI